MKNLLAIIIVFGLVVVAIGQSQPSDTKRYNADKYSVNYPVSWNLITNDNMNGGFFLFSKMESDNDVFRENVNLIIEKIDKDVPVDKYIEIAKKNIKSNMKNANILDFRVKGNEYELVYSGELGVNKLTWKQRYYEKNGYVFILTFTAETNSFAQFLDEADLIFNSFRIN